MNGVPATVENLRAAGVQVTHHFCGARPGPKPYIKESFVPAGCRIGQHSHPQHDHLAVLVRGSAMVTIDGISQTYSAVNFPVVLLFEAGKVHEIGALTDVVWFCTWATEDTDPATVDTSIMEGA